MSYERIEVNLLPPELQPGPAVRYGLMINIALIAGVITFIVLDLIVNSYRLSELIAQNKELEKSKANLQTATTDYDKLM
jgi:hypothetical protein